MSISINSHSSIQIDNLYFDPFQIKKPLPPAKYIFITHSHYDHLSVEDIKKVCDKNTIIIAPKDCKETLESNFENKVIYVKPKETLTLGGVQVKTFASYNLNKVFHKKEMAWVGYKITYDGTSYAIVGDSDATPELEKLSCDVLFLPIGGTYTMTAEEAATLAKKVKPKLVIPTHYGSIVGTKNDAKTFVKALNKEVEHKLLIK